MAAGLKASIERTRTYPSLPQPPRVLNIIFGVLVYEITHVYRTDLVVTRLLCRFIVFRAVFSERMTPA